MDCYIHSDKGYGAVQAINYSFQKKLSTKGWSATSFPAREMGRRSFVEFRGGP